MTQSVAVLQARTTSSRLPAKVLLPINGIPVVILAAKRAANKGLHVIVVTSDEPSDDALAEIAISYGINVFRGSLDNVLGRIVLALEAFHDDTRVFRLTADNVFPDGALLEEIEKDFATRSLNYLCCNGVASGVPYGMSVELMKLEVLREADKSVVTQYDREHVTPYIVRKYGAEFFEKYKELGKGCFRCTIDCYDDYAVAQSVFKNIDNPISISSLKLIDRLEEKAYQPLGSGCKSKLVLGAAQLGMNYGISNHRGQPSQTLATQIIKTAIANGVEYIDTARAYGNSEEVVGKALSEGWQGRVKVITKLSPLDECLDTTDAEVISARVDVSVFQSCMALNVKSLDVLMLHRAKHFTMCHGVVWKRLLMLKEASYIQDLGVSIQTPEELCQALSIKEISFIQMPLNILDSRWDGAVQKINKIKASRKLVIHIRSALLQGLLPSEDVENWERANVREHEYVRGWLNSQVERFNRLNIVDLCFSYVKSQPWVDGVAVGVEEVNQLKQNVRLFESSDFSEKVISDIKLQRPLLGDSTLNPANWKSA